MKTTPNFPATQWTYLERNGATPEGREWFCEQYYPAILGYLSQRYEHHEAEDLAQEFFAKVVLHRNIPGRAERSRGKLRVFLMRALKNFLSNYHRSRFAQKNGQALQVPLSHAEPTLADSGIPSPDRAFDKAWASFLFESAILNTEVECINRGKHRLFLSLRPLLDGSGPARTHAEIAAELNLKVRDVTIALHRLRQLVGFYLYEAVLRTVCGSENMEEEWKIIRQVLEE